MRSNKGLSKITYIVIIFIIVVVIYLVKSNGNNSTQSDSNVMNEENKVVYREMDSNSIQVIEDNFFENETTLDPEDLIQMDEIDTSILNTKE